MPPLSSRNIAYVLIVVMAATDMTLGVSLWRAQVWEGKGRRTIRVVSGSRAGRNCGSVEFSERPVSTNTSVSIPVEWYHATAQGKR